MLKVESLDHIVLTVADISVTCAFYRDVLGMAVVEFPVADGAIRTALRFGDQKINLHLAGAEFDPKASNPTAGSADMCFLTGTKLAEWITKFNDSGVDIEEGPVQRSGANGPVLSIYIRDPDQNLIEISNPLI